jgi:hypothetical protein
MRKMDDPDQALMTGCGSFLVVAVIGFGLVVAPFLVFLDTHRLSDLARNCALGMVPAAILSVVAVRSRGLATAFGVVGASLSAAVFLFLRLEQISMAAQAQQSPPVEYPDVFRYLVPLGWVLVSTLVAVASLKSEDQRRD